MEDSATEGLGVRHVVSYRRTIIIAVAVSFLNIPHFVNGVAFRAVSHDMNNSFIEWYEQQGMAQIFYIVVGILAYAFYAFLFQRCRRKTCLYSVCICQLTTSILLLFSRSYWMLQTSRAFSAIGDMGAGMFCVIYISEIAPYEIRGSLVAIHKLLYSLATLIPTVLYLMHAPLNPLPFTYISIVVSTLVAIWTFVGVPESPIFLLRREDMTGAKESLKFLYGNEADISHVIVNRKKILKATRSDSQATTSIFQECISRRALTFSSIAMTLFLLRIFAGFGAQRSQMEGTLWRLPKASEYNFSYLMPINDCLIILGNLIVLVLCDRVGRKILLLVSSFACVLCLIAFGIIIYLYQKFHYDTWDTVRALDRAFTSVYLLSFNLGVSVLPDVLISDIFPSKILNTQIAILGSIQLCVDYIVHYVIFNFMGPVLSGLGMLGTFAGLSLFVSVFIIKFLSETKCRPPGFLFMDSEERFLYSSLQDDDE